ncbi:reverse transcriptase domain-containing protein [Tanacetum coccineum]
MKKSDFHWTAETEEAFKQMKQLIAELPSVSHANGKGGTYRLFSSNKRDDFIVERLEEESSDTLMEEEEELLEPWILFDATNNKAEYEDFIAGLKITEQMGVKNLQANVDSRLVANQVNGTYVAKETDMIRYLEKVKTLTSSFKAFSIKQVPRSENKKADALIVEEEGDTWMTLIFKYLTDGTLPAKAKKSKSSETQVVAVLHNKWNPLQKILPRAMATPLTTSRSGLKQNQWQPLLATRSKNSCGTTLFVDLDFQEKSSRIMESNSKTIHSRIDARSYASANNFLLLNIRKPMAWWKGQTVVLGKG